MTSLNLVRVRQVAARIEQTKEKQRVRQRKSRLAAGKLQAGSVAVELDGRIHDASPEMLNVYRDRGAGLYFGYRWEECIPAGDGDYCVVGFAEWLLSSRLLWSEGTWRSNRAAATFYIRGFPDDRVDQALALLEFPGQRILHRQDDDDVACLMDRAHFQKIRDKLRLVSRSDYAVSLDDWMVAGVCTGVGPDEWMLTELDLRAEGVDQRFLLHIFNTRSTHLGSDGSYRTLDLSEFPADVLEIIRRVSDQGREWTLAGEYANRKSTLSKLLELTSRELFPHMRLRYTLDSLQHQSIANAQTRWGHVEVSAVLGDAFIDRNLRNYAHRRRAWDDCYITAIPKPSKESVLRFRRILKMYEDRKALRAK